MHFPVSPLLAAAVVVLGLTSGAARAAEDEVVADFEADSFSGWTITGTAFSTGPMHGQTPGQMPVDGYVGTGYASSFHGGDAAIGTLVSPPFTLSRKYLTFLIGGGGYAGETCLNLRVKGKVVRTATGPNTKPGGSERLYDQAWDVSDLTGQEATLEIVDHATGGWGHLSVDHIVQSDTPPPSPQARLLKEANDYVASRAPLAASDPLRPIYHVLPRSQSSGDPNGPVFFNGEYHLFYQHFPFWGSGRHSIFWGHAVSRDMVHWEHLPIAMAPGPASWDDTGIASGGCVIRDGVPTIVYTGFSSPGDMQVQSVATSSDNLRTWTKDPANPVLPALPDLKGLDPNGFRDPFVWKEGSEWCMLVGAGFPGDGGTVLLYRSADLRKWDFLGPLCKGGMGDQCYMWECSTLFPMGGRHVLIVSPLFRNIPGLRGDTRYASGSYRNNRFQPDEWLPVDLGGPRAYYAATTFEDQKKRRILWGMVMTPQSPAAGWSNCISLPRVVTAAKDNTLRYAPIPEMETLRKDLRDAGKPALKSDEEIVLDLNLGLYAETNLEVDLQSAGKVELRIGRTVDGGTYVPFSYDKASSSLTFGERKVDFKLAAKENLRLRVFTDGTVAEIFINERACFTQAMPVTAKSTGLSLVATGGNAKVIRCHMWPMSTIW